MRLDRFSKTGKKRIVVIFEGNRKIRGTRQYVAIRVHRN